MRKEEEFLYFQRLSDEMKTLKMRVQRTEKALNASKQLEVYDFSKPSLKPIALPPSGAGSGTPSSESELMQVDIDCSGSCSEPFADLEQVCLFFSSDIIHDQCCLLVTSSAPTYAHSEISALRT